MNKLSLSRSLRLLFALSLVMYGSSVSAQWLKASGKKIVDANSNEVILRGMGLGGWMLQEPYMMEMGGFAGTQWQMKDKIRSLIGDMNTQAFYDAWHANHCTRRDIDSLASWGFNSVRLPMHYNLYTLPIEDEPVVGGNTWLDKGFAMTDSLINWCKANHMYVILDLHAAPGGQGKDAAISDYNPAKPSLWENDLNKAKTIALWRKLAERYANEPWVGGYDLINEPNWSFTSGGNQNGCSETSNAPLRQLYIDLTNTIRQVDSKHIIIIEGNCWGNNYNGILPAWDNNMVLSFHKYWSTNDQGSISGIVGLRDQYTIPIWLGESGENSNAWFTDAIQLVEKNGIGWAWWPLKKINSIVNPLTIVKTADYQSLLNYWNNGGSAPTVSFATNALMQMAANARIENCIYRKDLTDAMFRQVIDSTTRPFSANVIPGLIRAAEFDLGRYGKAYSDSDIADYHVSTGTNTTWNSGYSFRNDGVDIGSSYDPGQSANVNYVGWTADNEWLQYSARVDSSAAYKVELRYANAGDASKIRLMVNGADVSGVLSLPATGGSQVWATFTIDNVILYKGQQKIRVYFEKGGVNLNSIGFFLSKKIEDVPCLAMFAETHLQTELIYLSCNKMLVDSTIKTADFNCMVNGTQVAFASLKLNAENHEQLVISLIQPVYDIDIIRLNFSQGHLKATDGTMLQSFTNLSVKNNLPIYIQVPGLIEAEAFSFNQGLALESCSDMGGGQDLGYTNAGDYLDYRVRVIKTTRYRFEARIACNSTSGRIQVQQLDSQGNATASAYLDVPVTGGWQTWQTVGTNIDLIQGICTLRVKIIQPEFNMNWFRFTENSTGIHENVTPGFKIFPNPASEVFNIQFPGPIRQKGKLTLRSSNGSVMKTKEVASNELTVKMFVGDLPKGLYIVEMESSGTIFRQKLIIY